MTDLDLDRTLAVDLARRLLLTHTQVPQGPGIARCLHPFVWCHACDGIETLRAALVARYQDGVYAGRRHPTPA